MSYKLIFFVLTLICPLTVLLGHKTERAIKITGAVLDANQKPIPGAAFFINKVKTGALTDSKGYYRIRVGTNANLYSHFSMALSRRR